jgi:hypothetical protein
MQFSPVTSSFFGPNILLSTLFSNTLSLCFSLNVSDQVSHPYRTTGKIMVFYRVLNTIYCPSVEFIICGDINIDYLKDSSRKKQLNTLVLSFNLFSIIDFPTRSQNKFASLIDNIFINYTPSGKYQVYPSINGLSDHDAQHKKCQLYEFLMTSVCLISKCKLQNVG